MKRAVTLGSSLLGISTVGYCVVVSQRPATEKLHIVMDLDSTILQTVKVNAFGNLNHGNVRDHDHQIGDEKDGYFVWHRPFAHSSLWFLNKLFVVHLFTAATKSYGEACLTQFPGLFENTRLFRESTKKETHGKDLTLITNDLNKIVLVDDQLRNRTGDQGFYHIPPYTRFLRVDFELLKFCLWALRWQFLHDIGAQKN